MRHAQRYWLEAQARDAVALGLDGSSDDAAAIEVADAVRVSLSGPGLGYLEVQRRYALREAAQALIRAEMLAREVAGRR